MPPKQGNGFVAARERGDLGEIRMVVGDAEESFIYFGVG